MRQSLVRKILKVVALSFAGLFLFATMLTAIINVTLGPDIEGLIGFRVDGRVDGAVFVPRDIVGEDIAQQIVLEGAVLLRNEIPRRGNNIVPGATRPVLPLTRGNTAPMVAVLGWGSTSWVPAGCGSGGVHRRIDEPYQGGAPTGSDSLAYGRGIAADAGNNKYAEVGIVNVPHTNTLGALELAGIEIYEPLRDFYLHYLGYNIGGNTRLRSVAPGRRPLWGGGPTAPAQGWSGALRHADYSFYRIIEPCMQENVSLGITAASNHTAHGGRNYVDILNSAAAATDTAIVVITRIAGESIDLPKVQYKGPALANAGVSDVDIRTTEISDPHRHYLEISIEEEALLTFAGANFNNTIVIVNSTNTMELGFLDTIPGLDAAFFVGATGLRAAAALPRLMWDLSERREILGGQADNDRTVPTRPAGSGVRPVSAGERIPFSEGNYLWPVVSPSGRTAGTFAYDMRTAASWNNAGDSNQDGSAAGWNNYFGGLPSGHTHLFNPNAPLEFGQRFFRNVTRADNLYPVGNSTSSGSGVNNLDSNHRGAALRYRYQQSGLAYIDYSEGIFVGYKWYETADAMGVWEGFSHGPNRGAPGVIPDWFRDSIGTQLDLDDNGNPRPEEAARNALRQAHNQELVQRSREKIPYERVCFRTGERIRPTGIDAVVQFPFGFGLSFAEFEWEISRVIVGNNVEFDAGGEVTRGTLIQNTTSNTPVSPTYEVVVEVLVTNVGNTSGMEVVQLYNNPLTWDEDVALEMSAANLIAFGKTYQVLYPRGNTQNMPSFEVVRLRFYMYDLASFDTYNASGVAPLGGFVLLQGLYEISIRHNSNHVSNATGITGTQHTARINLEIGSDHLFTYDPQNFREHDPNYIARTPVISRFSGNAARNRAAGGDGVPIADTYRNAQGVEVQRMAQMRRNDFIGTFPILRPSRDITQDMRDINLLTTTMIDDWRDNFQTLYGFAPTDQQAAGRGFTWNDFDFSPTHNPGNGQEAGLTLSSAPTPQQQQFWDQNFSVITPVDDNGYALEGAALRNWFLEADPFYRTRLGPLAFYLAHSGGNRNAPWNPVWDDFTRLMSTTGVSGGSASNPVQLVGGSGFLRNGASAGLGERPFPLVGRPRTHALDATNQMNSFRGRDASAGSAGIGWPNATTVAQTWSYILARRQGWEKGNEARIRNVAGMLSPGIHVHRSPLNGRNFEYYSESGFLTGIIASNYIRGLMDMGIYTYIKHLAVYVQESNRNGLYIFLTEQALREIYLVPFRMGMNRYASTGHGSVGIMSGYSRIGAMWEGGSFHLLTTVVRREWGFRGSIMTDWADNGRYMCMDHAIRAGGDKAMGNNYVGWSAGTGHVRPSVVETTSPEIQHRLREAARNLHYTWFWAEYMHANFNAYEAGISLPPVNTSIPNFNWIEMLFMLVWFLFLPLSIIGVAIAYLPDIIALFKKDKAVATAAGSGVSPDVINSDPPEES